MIEFPASLAEIFNVELNVELAQELLRRSTGQPELDERSIDTYADLLRAGRPVHELELPVLDRQNRLLAGHSIALAVLLAKRTVTSRLVVTKEDCLPPPMPKQYRSATPVQVAARTPAQLERPSRTAVASTQPVHSGLRRGSTSVTTYRLTAPVQPHNW